MPPPVPRSFTTTTDDHGSFLVSFDQEGTVDVTIRPDSSTNFPWSVFPQVSAVSALPSIIALTNPAFLGGAVTDPHGTPIANATIDAWFPVRNASGLTGTVVKIGTTTTDANGKYTLVLPALVD
jgi:hypothetical protein